MSRAKAGAILVAAGSGVRLKAGVRKAWVRLGGRPLLAWALRALDASPRVGEIALVVHPEDLRLAAAFVARRRGLPKPVHLAVGGRERQDSVAHGLQALRGAWPAVLVQDAGRPFMRPHRVQAWVDSALSRGSGIAAVPVKDSIKRARSGRVESLPRAELWAAQTPQALRRGWLEKAQDWAQKGRRRFTDEAGLVEAWGRRVHLVQAYYENMKVTTPEDLVVAKALSAGFRAGR